MRWFIMILALVVAPALAGQGAACQSPGADRVSALSSSEPLVLEQVGAPELLQAGGTVDALGIVSGTDWVVGSPVIVAQLNWSALDLTDIGRLRMTGPDPLWSFEPNT